MILGLTGGMGCGKTTAAGMLAGHGFVTLDSDAIIRTVLLAEQEVIAATTSGSASSTVRMMASESSGVKPWLPSIPAAVVFMAMIAVLAGRCLAGMRSRSRDAHLPAIGFASTVFVALHAVVDFGAQIPAVAISYAVLLGMGWAQSWSSRET